VALLEFEDDIRRSAASSVSSSVSPPTALGVKKESHIRTHGAALG